MGNQVKFVETTQNTYNTLETRENSTLYFTTDTKRLYRGNELFSSELTPVYDGNGKKFSDWTITREGVDVTDDVEQPAWIPSENQWGVYFTPEDSGEEILVHYVQGDEDDTSIAWEYTGGSVYQYVGMRSENNFLGYAIAGQTDKPLVPASLLPAASDDDPKIAGTKDSGTSGDYSRADHVHPSETEVEYEVATPYNLSSNALPITFKVSGNEFSKNSVAQITESAGIGLLLVAEGMTDPIVIFDKDTGFFTDTTSPMITDMAFGGRSAEAGVWPRLDVTPSSVSVRGASVQMPLSPTQLANIEDVPNKIDKLENPTNGNLVCVDSTGGLYDSGLNAAKVDERISTMRQACEVLWWDDPSKYNDNAGSAGRIYFRPREAGMWDGGCISVINFHTATTTAVNANIYLKLVSSDQETVYATSDTKSINGTNIWVPFTFTAYAPLEKDTQYILQFIDASTGQVHGNIRPRLQPNASSPDLYFAGNQNLRPHITVRWLMDLTNVKEKLEDHENRIQALETAIANMAS
jgi:hypothetical protein